MRPLIITGCQRSGTAFVAAMITASGYWCSHERFFREREWWMPRPDTIEASWAAAPFLSKVDAHVVHQLRHPLAVISSMLARGTFHGGGRRSVRWARKRYKQIHRPGDTEIEAAMRYWLHWNQLVERHADRMWQIEKLNPGTLAQALTDYGRPVSAGRVARGWEVLPARINEWKGVTRLTWRDLPQGKLKHRLQEAARRWGYRV